MMMLPRAARLPSLVAILSLGIALSLGALLACQREATVQPETTGVDAAQLSGSCYGIAVEDDASGALLLGNLCFEALSEETLTGTWNLEAWGHQPQLAQAQFAGLPANEGEGFPATEAMAAFEAEVFGDLVILALDLPATEDHLGVVLERLDGEHLTGSAAVLPQGAFRGRVDGVLRPE